MAQYIIYNIILYIILYHVILYHLWDIVLYIYTYYYIYILLYIYIYMCSCYLIHVVFFVEMRDSGSAGSPVRRLPQTFAKASARCGTRRPASATDRALAAPEAGGRRCQCHEFVGSARPREQC